MYDFFQRGVFHYGANLRRHHLINLAPTCMRIFARQPTRSKDELEPARTAMLSSNLGAAQKVALGDDFHEIPGSVDNG